MDSQELQSLKNRYDIIGNVPALNLALEVASKASPVDLPVLVMGESGTGKDVIPRMIHQLSRRRTGKYLAVNCGALPPGTVNAELFGHEKGAFTGAVGERKGYFEEADGGTLFLDEISELPRDTQAMLLRVLQDGEYLRVGSSKVRKTDVRIIAATNVDLGHAVAAGKFRHDLYYRLNAVIVRMPALRERRTDIELLFRKFSSDFASRFNLCKISLTHDAILALMGYRWPGNIRQLKNVAEAVTGLESPSATPTMSRIELGEDIIRKYLPDERDTLLPAVSAASAGGSSSGGGMSEEDKFLFTKALMELKAEVDMLRQKVDSCVASGAPAINMPHTPAAPVGAEIHSGEAEWQEQEDGFDQPSQGGISLKKADDDLIEKALLRHGGNVKKAAAELGISERTISRWRSKMKNGA